MAVTVVIPTRDRPGGLARCLAALAGQDLGRIEVVVVDDGSRGAGGVERALSGFEDVRAIPGGGRGPAAARNAGARAADGDVVLFTDDDCEPEPGWARLLSGRAARDGVAAGRTIAPPASGAPAIASQEVTNRLLLAGLTAGGTLAFAPSCNLGCSREAIAELPFDESYPDAAGEDRDWCARAVAAGRPPAYVPEAIVAHHQELGLGRFLRRQVRYGRGAVRYRRGATGDRSLEDASFYAGLVRAGFARGPAVGALVVAAQVATAAGVATELARALSARPEPAAGARREARRRAPR